jgi:signal-transduction protein with cAMP-binding, CBS, and nucleotidyltransferase domain
MEVATIAPEASIKRAADWLRAKDIDALVVMSNDSILGIISERDIVRAFSQYGESVASMQVKDIMTHGEPAKYSRRIDLYQGAVAYTELQGAMARFDRRQRAEPADKVTLLGGKGYL